MRGQDQIHITTGGLKGSKAEDANQKEYTMYLEEGSGARVVQTIREVLAECSLSSSSSSRTSDPITCVRVSEDQNTYLASCLGGTLRLVDIHSGSILKEYKGHTHSSFKTEACFDSDHQHLIGGSEDGSIVHWDLLSGGVTYRTPGAHKKAISSIACHPSKSMFLTASYDGTVKCWDNSEQIAR
eukprot:gene25833-32329_t